MASVLTAAPKSIGERSAATRSVSDRAIRYALFLAWLVVVVVETVHHVFWRDEVRALSLALQGDSPGGFFAAIHGEGHPLLWYMLLRGGYMAFHTEAVLPVLGLVIGVAAMLVLVARAPFRWPMIGLILLSHFAIFEYTVMARNYGIAALFIFLFAAAYPSQRGRGVVLGALLFLLANTNVHSIPIGGALLLFWGLNIVFESGLKWTPALKVFALNATLFLAGVAACALTVFPTFNDAGARDLSGGLAVPAIKAVFDPASQFHAITIDCLDVLFGGVDPWSGWAERVLETVMSVVLFAAALGLAKRPSALIAAFAALIGLALLFAVGVEGQYRHEALWIVLLIALYWMSLDPRLGEARPRLSDEGRKIQDYLAQRGGLAFVALLVLQALPGGVDIVRAAVPDTPASRSQDVARLIQSRPDLRQAVIVADPDGELEALPYYMPNRLYLMREHRFGDVVRFTKHAQLDMSLADVLNNMRALRAQTGSPVVILLQQHLDTPPANGVVQEGYDWTLSMTPAQIQAFQAATIRLARFAPSRTGEDYDVYQLR